MRAASALHRLTALGLALILISCNATRSSVPVPATPEAFSRYVLVVEELPNGEVTHAWKPASDFELSKYPYRASRPRLTGPLRLAASTRDCHAEYMQCMKECLKSPLPSHLRHVPRGGARHEQICNEKCMPPYLDCCRLQELEAKRFTAMDPAIDWLKRNRKGILVGTVVVIAGVAFVVVSAGAGMLVLAPALLLASSDLPSESPLTEASP
jgi:hypothetical protein